MKPVCLSESPKSAWYFTSVNITPMPIAQIKIITRMVTVSLDLTRLLPLKIRKPRRITVPQIKTYSLGALNGSASFGFTKSVIRQAVNKPHFIWVFCLETSLALVVFAM
jgi:hypothetical protein